MNFCVKTAAIWQFGGYLLYLLKVLIPLIILILGVIDLVKSIISSNDDLVASSIKTLIRRLILAVIVFFIPLLVSLGISVVSNASKFTKNAEACQVCLLNPTNIFTNKNNSCENYIQMAKEGNS